MMSQNGGWLFPGKNMDNNEENYKLKIMRIILSSLLCSIIFILKNILILGLDKKLAKQGFGDYLQIPPNLLLKNR